jgi:hypothetical protein
MPDVGDGVEEKLSETEGVSQGIRPLYPVSSPGP